MNPRNCAENSRALLNRHSIFVISQRSELCSSSNVHAKGRDCVAGDPRKLLIPGRSAPHRVAAVLVY